jgi:hypothetical protein
MGPFVTESLSHPSTGQRYTVNTVPAPANAASCVVKTAQTLFRGNRVIGRKGLRCRFASDA